jgi:hypothetical protein
VSDLKRMLMASFPDLTDDDFAFYATDLYVVYSQPVMEWLRKNHEFHKTCQVFTSPKESGWNGAGQMCIDIPFGGEWVQKRIPSTPDWAK